MCVHVRVHTYIDKFSNVNQVQKGQGRNIKEIPEKGLHVHREKILHNHCINNWAEIEKLSSLFIRTWKSLQKYCRGEG